MLSLHRVDDWINWISHQKVGNRYESLRASAASSNRKPALSSSSWSAMRCLPSHCVVWIICKPQAVPRTPAWWTGTQSESSPSNKWGSMMVTNFQCVPREEITSDISDIPGLCTSDSWLSPFCSLSRLVDTSRHPSIKCSNKRPRKWTDPMLNKGFTWYYFTGGVLIDTTITQLGSLQGSWVHIHIIPGLRHFKACEAYYDYFHAPIPDPSFGSSCPASSPLQAVGSAWDPRWSNACHAYVPRCCDKLGLSFLGEFLWQSPDFLGLFRIFLWNMGTWYFGWPTFPPLDFTPSHRCHESKSSQRKSNGMPCRSKFRLTCHGRHREITGSHGKKWPFQSEEHWTSMLNFRSIVYIYIRFLSINYIHDCTWLYMNVWQGCTHHMSVFVHLNPYNWRFSAFHSSNQTSPGFYSNMSLTVSQPFHQHSFNSPVS